MKKGLIIGKFMPPHEGHRALIEFAASRCDTLTVLVGALKHEPIPAFAETMAERSFSEPFQIMIDYTDEDLPTAEESSGKFQGVGKNF